MEELVFRDRRNTSCIKWDGLSNDFTRNDLLPLWVADMDFASPKCVTDALHKAADFGVFGYNKVPESYYEAFINWEKTRHNFEVKREWIRYSPGVVAGFSWFIELLTEKTDSVMIQVPVYSPFHKSVRASGRKLVTNELINTNGVYTVDYEDFEQKIVSEKVKLFILCSPHNPLSRVWKKEELVRMFDICRKHGVKVVVDEIHHDFIYGDHIHHPGLSVGDYGDMMVMLTAPSKTFNLAGMKNSIVIIPNEEIRKKYDEFTNYLHVEAGGNLGYLTVEAAYRDGGDWFDAVLAQIHENYEYLCTELKKHLPKLVITPLEGTYLMWIDFSAYLKPEEMKDYLENRCHLALDYGTWFEGNAACHVRLNLATSKEIIEKAARAIIENL